MPSNNIFSYGPDSTPADYGLFGGQILSSGTANFNFYYLVFLQNTTVTSATLAPNWSGSIDGMVFSAGSAFSIRGTSITTSGGSVIVYKETI